MVFATKRGVRRSTATGKQKRRNNSLLDIAGALDKAQAKYGLSGHVRGERRMAGFHPSVVGVTMAFRHPTKKATAGRYGFLHTSNAAAAEIFKPREAT